MLSGQRVGRQRAAGVGLQQRHRHAQIGGQVIAVEEIGGADDRAHLLLVIVGLGPGPVAVPAGHVIRSGAAVRIETGGRLRRLARMAAGAGIGKDASCRGRGPAGRSVRYLSPPGASFSRWGLVAFRKNSAVCGVICFGGLPVGRVALRDRDLDRRDRLAAGDRVEMQQPFLAEQADIQIDAVERAERADRIGPVLQDARRPRRYSAGRRTASADRRRQNR